MKTPNKVQPPAIGTRWHDSTDLYAGVMRGGYNGEPDYVLLLGPDLGAVATWGDAMKWASQLDGNYTLPNLRESALLFANLPDQFAGLVYWTREQLAEQIHPTLAFQHNYCNGQQDFEHTSHAGAARVVRRIPLAMPVAAPASRPPLKLIDGGAAAELTRETSDECIH